MSKLQILNETQVQHFVDAISPELRKIFDEKVEFLKAQAKKDQNNFITHERVLKLKEEQKKEYELAEQIMQIHISLQSIDKTYYVSKSNYYGAYVRTEQDLQDLKKRHEERIVELIYELSQIALFVDNSYIRREQMMDDLRARLSMTVVEDFDSIKAVILKSISVDSYFTYTI